MRDGANFRPLPRGEGADHSGAGEGRFACPRVLDRRAILAALAALLAGCDPAGKLMRRLAFAVPDESLSAVASAIRAFAARETFKFQMSETGFDRYFLLAGDDIDIAFEPHEPGDMPAVAAVPEEAPAQVNDAPPAAPPPPSPPPPPHVSPARYEAWFFVHTPDGVAPRLDALANRFSVAVSSVEGVRKIP